MENYSVLMSVYHKEKPEYLRQSIQSMLDQTVPTNDFVIVCDGPLTPELDNIIKYFSSEYPNLFQIIRLPENVGLGLALNEGINNCKNELIARMDSDDYSFPDRCKLQLEIFNSRQVDIVSGTIVEFEENINHIASYKRLPEENGEILQYAKKRSPFNHACIMYKKEMVLRAGSYQHFLFFEDYYLWVRMLMAGAKGYNLQKIIYGARADSHMYKRRGGLNYVKSILKFRIYLLNSGFINSVDFCIGVAGHSLVALLPWSLREKLYKRFLRDKA